ncbi:MAG: LysR family transcriptional regulator [Coriobacteriales bacterium]
MNIEHLREFTVFSQYLNFSKAARRLNLAQPTLSSHIAAMEAELGFKLVRRGREIELTPAGKCFCAKALRLLRSYDSAVQESRKIAKEREYSLVFEETLEQSGLEKAVSRVLRGFERTHQGISVRKHSSTDSTLADVLEFGIADLVFTFYDDAETLAAQFKSKVEVIPAHLGYLGPYYLWVHESHHLAGREQIYLTETEGCRYLIPTSVRFQGLRDLADLALKAVGISVDIDYWPGSYEECILNIDPEDVMIINGYDLEDPIYSSVENRVCVRLKGFSSFFRPAFVCLSDNTNPALALFKEHMAQVGAVQGEQPQPASASI